MPPIPAQILQMAVAALGGALFHALGIPAAWLSGSVVAVVIWGDSDRRVRCRFRSPKPPC